ncbi:MAG: hypothetical protein E7295_10855 [Lachnospiraceae bacterium]|jgi:hypothetical protein|nr:hypothetical protein [Lachnospiraceae bacterium]
MTEKQQGKTIQNDMSLTKIKRMHGTKDIAEKALIDFTDVFADIVNMIFFSGEHIVSEVNLHEIQRTSVYDGKDSLRFQVRDVAKLWHRSEVQLVYIGVENETKPEKDMPLRMIGYDGTDRGR